MRIASLRVRTACAIAGIAFAVHAFPAAPPGIPPAQDSSGQETLDYLRAQVFQSFPRESPGASRSGGQLEGFVGREEFYMAKLSASLSACVPVRSDPLSLIEQRARHTSIVIINENHSSPLDCDS